MPSIINAATSGGLISTADTSGVLQLQTASTTALTITAAQNVGIGTASPAAKVEISGTAAAQNLALRITNTATDGYSTLQLGGSGDGGVFRNGSSQSGYAGASSLNLITVGAHAIGLATGNTIRAIIPAAGGVQSVNCVSVGNATPSASGAGITFPATQSASSDANTLDDYEEGFWTPAYLQSGSGSITHNTQVGRYIKIGQSVFCTLEISTNSVTSLTGYMQISGLPFTSRSGIYAGSISVGYINAFDTIGPVRGYVNQNATTAFLVSPVSATTDTELPASSMRNATGANYLIATISYLTAS